MSAPTDPPAGDATESDLETAAEPTPRADDPAQIGPYRILERLGEGGMGTVYRARQDDPIRREVALKQLRHGLHDDAVRRFEAERQALALMRHPNIAQVYDAGWTADRPYFAMELVDGEPLVRDCDRRRLDVRRRVELFVTVCRAVQHAHEKGVIHRDLKPSNILVTEVDGKPLPKIIDFGIAKATGSQLVDETIETGHRLIGTPGYMSPEALLASEGGPEIDTRSDIYSLGVVLYSLLLGVLPFGTTRDGQVRIIQRVLSSDPPHLDRRASQLDDETLDTLAAQRCTERRDLRRRLRGDLTWIVDTAIARDRARRYASAAEMADDLERYLRREPVLVGPPTASYRLRKLVRRHAVATSLVLLLIVALVGGLVARTLEAQRASREAARAQRAAAEAEQVSRFLVELFESTDPWNAPDGDAPRPPGDTPVRVVLARGAERIQTELEDQPLVRARLMIVISNVYRQLGEVDQATELAREALAIRREHLPADHLDIAEVLYELGWLEDWIGDTDAAEEAFREACAIRQAQLGPVHEAVGDCLNALGWMLRSKGELADAEAQFRRALEVRREASGARDPEVAESLGELAWTLRSLGRPVEAEELLRESLAIRREAFGDHHPAVARAQRDLGLTLQQTGHLDDAETALRASLAVSEATYGPRHSKTLITRLDLAGVLTERGSVDEAEELYRRLLDETADDVRLRDLVPVHYGRLLVETGRAGEAIDRLRPLLSTLRAPARNPAVLASALGTLGEALHATGALEESEAVLRESLETRAGMVEPPHPQLALGHRRLARTLLSRGHLQTQGPCDDAVRHAQRAVEMYEQLVGDRPALASELDDARALLAACLTADCLVEDCILADGLAADGLVADGGQDVAG